MRVISNPFLLFLPAFTALLLLGLFSAPLRIGTLGISPNIGLLFTLILASLYPAAWPRPLAFLFGLMQDILYGTPPGSQALLLLAAHRIGRWQGARGAHQQFQLRWLEAAGVLVIWHLFLCVLLLFVTPDATPLRALLRAGLVNAAWYPVVYFPLAWWRE